MRVINGKEICPEPSTAKVANPAGIAQTAPSECPEMPTSTTRTFSTLNRAALKNRLARETAKVIRIDWRTNSIENQRRKLAAEETQLAVSRTHALRLIAALEKALSQAEES